MSQNPRPRPIIGPLNIYSILALAGIVGPLVLIIADLTAAISEPNYNPILDSVSSLAWAPMGWLQTIGFLVAGLLVEVFIAGLFFNIRGGYVFRIGVGLLVCFGFGLLLIGAFRTDPVGSQRTIEGMIHLITANTVFCLFPIASFLIAFSIRKDPYWKGVFVHTIVASGLASAFVIGHICLSVDLSWFGLYERALVANTVIWVEIVAVKLLCLSLSTRERLNRSAIF